MGEFIHFRGKDAILKAYESQGIPCCALVSGKDIIFCYDGGDIDEGVTELGDFLDRLKLGHSQGVYQLRVYKFPPKDRDINLSTKQNLSFKCRILDQDESDEVSQGAETRFEYQRRLKALEERLASRETEIEEESEEPVPVWQQAINGVLQRPDVQNFVIGKIFNFMEKIFGASPATPATAHAMNGVPEEAKPSSPGEGQASAEQLYQQLPATEREMLDAAMGILLANDPQIGTNLYKVANLLKTSPAKYRAFAAMI